MKWYVLIAVCCLLLGVGTTIVVVCACAAWSTVEEVPGRHPSELTMWKGQQWWVQVNTATSLGIRTNRIGGVLRRVMPEDENAKEITWPKGLAGSATIGPYRVVNLPHWSNLGVTLGRLAIYVDSEEACGWPMYAAMCSTHEYELGEMGIPTFKREILQPDSAIHLERWEITIFQDTVSVRQLPIIPIWTGFLFNSVFFGFLWLVAGTGLKRLKILTRRQRGLCPKCAYNLRRDFDAGCPECGWNRDRMKNEMSN